MLKKEIGDDVVSFVKYIHKGIKKFGISRIEKNLRDIPNFVYESNQRLIREKIFNELTCVFGFSKTIIIKSKKRGDVAQAKTMAIILFNAHLDLTQADIASFFDRTQSLVSKRIKSFDDFMAFPLKSHDKIFSNGGFVEKFKKVNSSVIEFKKNLK